jgi:hypothetical protein
MTRAASTRARSTNSAGVIRASRANTREKLRALILAALAKVMGRGDVPAPFETECPFYALLEFEATTEEVANHALETFEHCVEQGWVLDGVAINHIAMTAELQDRFDFSEPYSEKPELAIPFQKGNPAFKASLDKALGRVKADGRLKALAQKWFEDEKPVAKAQ